MSDISLEAALADVDGETPGDTARDRRQNDIAIAQLKTWAKGHDRLCQTRESNALEHRAAVIKRVGRIEGILIAQFSAIILGGATVLWAVLQISFKLP